MREAVFLHYRAGSTLWHRHSPSLKLGELAIWSLTVMVGNPRVLIAAGCVIIICHIIAGSRLRWFRKPLFFWLIMALAITFFAGLSDSGSEKAVALTVSGRSLGLGRAGLITGALRSLRLLTVLMAGQLLASTTDPADLAEALRQFTFFLPKSWSGRLAVSVSLTISFIPKLMDEALRVQDAALSRGLGQRRSIFRRALSLGLPMADATLRRADLTAEALISRCPDGEPKAAVPKIGPADILIFTLSVIPVIITFIAAHLLG